ncbi:MAG: hypothetical protein ACOC0P_03955, partial [Planctomycetota bacterium]
MFILTVFFISRPSSRPVVSVPHCAARSGRGIISRSLSHVSHLPQTISGRSPTLTIVSAREHAPSGSGLSALADPSPASFLRRKALTA